MRKKSDVRPKVARPDESARPKKGPRPGSRQPAPTKQAGQTGTTSLSSDQFRAVFEELDALGLTWTPTNPPRLTYKIFEAAQKINPGAIKTLVPALLRNYGVTLDRKNGKPL